ncbi:hypothetical protein DICA3_D06062 [Diutina catenulata]
MPLTKIKRSRKGCHACKENKMKCDETKPSCGFCLKNGRKCDYSLKLSWGGRPVRTNPGREQYTPATYRKRKLKQEPGSSNKAARTNVSVSNRSALETQSPQRINGSFPSAAETAVLEKSQLSHLVDLQPDNSPPYNPKTVSLANSILLSDSSEGGIKADEISLKTTQVITTPSIAASGSANHNDGLLTHWSSPTDSKCGNAIGKAPSSNSSDSSKSILLNDDWVSMVQDTRMRAIDSSLTATPIQTVDDYLLNYEEDNARVEVLTNFIGDTSFSALDDSVTSYSVAPPIDGHLSSTIPPSLMPWPELLLNVPYYRKLLHFMVTEGCTHLIPAPWCTQSENPFQTLLPRMAMEFPSVLTTILAFASKLRTNILGYDESPNEVRDHLLSRSCTQLMKLLGDKDTAYSECTLATILLLSSYEAFDTRDMDRHRLHARGARKVIRMRLRRGHRVNEISYFLLRWFLYLDVVGSLSTTTHHQKYIANHEDTSIVDQLRTYKGGIDHLTGMETELYPHFSRISALIRTTQQFYQRTGLSAAPFTVIEEAIDIKDAIDKIAIQELTPDEGDIILVYTNRLFCNMALMNLYRRVLGVSRHTLRVQSVVSSTKDILSRHIEPKSPAGLCTVCCTFIIACEALNPQHQEFFFSRLEALAQMGNVSAIKGLQVVKRCWSTGEDMSEAARMLDIDVTLL